MQTKPLVAKRLTTVLSIALFLILGALKLQAQSPFYQGKTITLVVGFTAGSYDDLWPRLIAQYLPKYIPGNPTVIVQNMPGAGSMIAANYLYGVVKPDGLTLGGIQPALYFNQLIGLKEVKFDWPKFNFIGSPWQSPLLLYMRADTPYKTIQDVRTAAEPPKCGSTGPSSTGNYFPKLLNDILGTKFQVVSGYQGGTDVDLAVERGELHCRAFTIVTYFGREPFFTWEKKGFVRNLIQTGRKRDPRLPNVPTIYELMDQYKTPESGRRLAAVVLANDDMGRPIVMPPGVPPERVKIVRDAFNQAMADSKLLDEAKKKKLESDPTGGEELQAIAKEIMAQPPEIIERMKKLFSD
jgi:tripartite-type tricarboxylate transporter receptor subunit TctC